VDLSLAKYDAACRAIDAAKSVLEARKIRDTAEALRAYAKQAKNKDLEVDAAEIRIRAERRVGELIRKQKGTIGLAPAGRPKKIGSDEEPISRQPTLADAGIDKKLSFRGQRLARMSRPEFETLIVEWRRRVQLETERVTTNLLRVNERESKTVRPLPAGTYRLIYADPPWRYEHVETESRAVENQYPTMALEDICALDIPAADDAVLFLWATSPKLREAMTVIESWRFVYRTCAIWNKEIIGMGYYFRQQHELLLVAARGALPVPEPSARQSSMIRCRRTEHSEKPDLFYDMLEKMYPTFTELDRIELFARRSRAGWTCWSNEPALAV